MEKSHYTPKRDPSDRGKFINKQFSLYVLSSVHPIYICIHLRKTYFFADNYIYNNTNRMSISIKSIRQFKHYVQEKEALYEIT